MRKRISILPPTEFRSYSPSQLFKFFFQLGRWTEESFSADFQTYTRGTLISSVTVNKWKNHNAIPTRYAGPLFKLIEAAFEPHIATLWIDAFEVVWATHLARSTDIQDGTKERFNHPELSDAICDQHSRWINTLYAKNLFGENFSTRDIYVPIQLIERQESEIILYNNEDLLNLFKPTEKINWACITGAAGSGKSMLALHLAQELSKTDIMPIYLRGQNISDIEIDIQDSKQPIIDSFSAKSFLKHFRGSERKTACLILDGIDEIPGTRPEIIKLFSDLRVEQNVCQAHGKNLSIVTFSRLGGLDYIKLVKNAHASRHLEILGLDGREKTQNKTDDFVIGEDMRSAWWKTYLAATGRKPDDTLPDFLCTDYADFQEFGADPLWSCLICQTAIENEADKNLLAHEAVNKFTYSENTNIIYQSVVNYISQGTEALNNITLMQNLALAHWKQSQDETPLSDALLQGLSPPEDTAPYKYKTTYFCGIKTNNATDQKNGIEFTYEKLSHYLVSTLILDRFIELIQTQGDADKFNEALKDWAAVSGQGSHDPVLADFCQKETRLRYADLRGLNWDSALSIIKDQLHTEHYSRNGLSTVSNILNSANLLFFIWSCFNLERYKNSGTPYGFSEEPTGFNVSTVRQIHRTNFLNFQKGSLIKPSLGRDSFLAPSLSALHLSAADLSQLSFSLGHMESFSCEKSNFAMTHWSHVKMSASSFKKSAFQQAIFHGCRWQDSKLESCLFQGAAIENSTFLDCHLSGIFFSQCHFSDVDFLSSTFEGVIFDRCVFTNCGFETKIENTLITSVEFRYCTFLSMEKSLQKFPEGRLAHCIIQSTSETKEILSDKFL